MSLAPPKLPDLNPEMLHFRPRWWWDPVPPWLLEHLDLKVLKELAATQLQLEKTVLEAQVRAVDQAMKVIQGK